MLLVIVLIKDPDKVLIIILVESYVILRKSRRILFIDYVNFILIMFVIVALIILINF